MQQPPHLLIRVQSGKTNVEGSSSSFRETSCSSGMHLAGVGLTAFDRCSPPNLSGKNFHLYLECNRGNLFFKRYSIGYDIVSDLHNIKCIS